MDYKQEAERPSGAHNGRKQGAAKQKGIKKVVIVAVVSVVIVAILAVTTMLLLSSMNNKSAKINKDDYQAVFLTNGQVYFGKLQNADGNYLTLTNIYYLQVDSDVQQAGTTDKKSTTNSATDSNVQLIKLGNELHGPRDEMQLNNTQVLFWENLKSDSKVSEAIKNYKQ
ncbi:hypothetical protein BGO17_03280 [Candidatus Saccharibacteria bacterium 49-20]|nr:MAG: hypothetical protein BGO17_03280 [Candidatus Saccharibacteria bacterium 49-20]